MERNEALNLPDVPYLVHEEELTRMERNVTRWCKAWFITFVMLILAVGFIVYRETQYEDVMAESYYAETTEGGTAIANGSGEVTVNGESELQEGQD